MKIAIWTYIPSHHQSDFLDALRSAGVDLAVRYCFPTLTDRLTQGWNIPALKAGEAILKQGSDIFFEMPDWRKRIHIVAGYGLPFLRSVIWRLSSENIPWVHWSEHPNSGLKRYLMYPIRMLYAQLINRTALGALAISHLAAQSFVSWGVRPDRITIMPYSITTPLVSTMDPVCKEFVIGRKSFLFVGQLIRKKAVDILLKSFSQCEDINNSWCLLLIGTGNAQRQLKNLAVQLQIDHKTLFRGPVPSNSISSVFSLGSVLILPSRDDGWGVVLNEGAALGLPLIASNRVGAGYHLIDPGVNGYRVLAGCSDSLAEAMQTYITNPDLITAHGVASKRNFSQYTPEYNAQRLISILRSWMAARQ